jgi:hypothetical protein
MIDLGLKKRKVGWPPESSNGGMPIEALDSSPKTLEGRICFCISVIFERQESIRTALRLAIG